MTTEVPLKITISEGDDRVIMLDIKGETIGLQMFLTNVTAFHVGQSLMDKSTFQVSRYHDDPRRQLNLEFDAVG